MSTVVYERTKRIVYLSYSVLVFLLCASLLVVRFSLRVIFHLNVIGLLDLASALLRYLWLRNYDLNVFRCALTMWNLLIVFILGFSGWGVHCSRNASFNGLACLCFFILLMDNHLWSTTLQRLVDQFFSDNTVLDGVRVRVPRCE